jgi:hypothetical protein
MGEAPEPGGVRQTQMDGMAISDGSGQQAALQRRGFVGTGLFQAPA